MGMRFIDLIGTTKDRIKFGITGPLIKAVTGAFHFRNAADGADAEITASKLNVSGDDIVVNSDSAGAGADWKVTLRRNSAGMAADVIFPLPIDAGSTGDVLTKTASGSEWAAPSAVGGPTNVTLVESQVFSFGTASPLALLTTTATEVLYTIRVHVTTVFNGTAPQLSIGIAGNTAKYVAATEIDLKTIGIYEIAPGFYTEGVEAIIGTYVADGSSAGSARIEIHYGSPS